MSSVHDINDIATQLVYDLWLQLRQVNIPLLMFLPKRSAAHAETFRVPKGICTHWFGKEHGR